MWTCLDLNNYVVNCRIIMISITNNLKPDIIGSGVGFCGDGCGIRLCGFICVTEGVIESASGDFPGSNQCLWLAVVNKTGSCCRSFRNNRVCFRCLIGCRNRHCLRRHYEGRGNGTCIGKGHTITRHPLIKFLTRFRSIGCNRYGRSLLKAPIAGSIFNRNCIDRFICDRKRPCLIGHSIITLRSIAGRSDGI